MNTKVIAKVLPATLALGLIVTVSSLPSYAGKFWKNHPRRAEVLGRDRNINNRINNNKGNLDGHYGQLKAEDKAIRKQEQFDARANGGHITRGEQKQLNKEENHLNNQIKRDER